VACVRVRVCTRNTHTHTFAHSHIYTCTYTHIHTHAQERGRTKFLEEDAELLAEGVAAAAQFVSGFKAAALSVSDGENSGV